MAVMCFYDWLKLSSPIVQNVIHVKSINSNFEREAFSEKQ